MLKEIWKANSLQPPNMRQKKIISDSIESTATIITIVLWLAATWMFEAVKIFFFHKKISNVNVIWNNVGREFIVL